MHGAMSNKIAPVIIALVLAFGLVGIALAYTTNTYSNAVCNGTSIGTLSNQSTNSCVSYCASLNATCCTTKTYANYIGGETTYSCTATNGTTYSSQAAVITRSGGELTSRTSWTATLIDYSGVPVAANLVANPSTVTTGQPSSILTWSSTGATSCTGTNLSTGGAISGSVTVSPTVDTLYTVTCSNATQTGQKSVYVYAQQFKVSCTVDTGTGAGFGIVGYPVTWTATPQYGPGTYSYQWSGTDDLTGTLSSTAKTYTVAGQKFATVTVTSGSYQIITGCPYTACTGPSCSSDGIIVTSSDSSSPDLTAGNTSLASGTLTTGSSLTFSAALQNIGLGSVDAYFQNRFQIDVRSSGDYVYLDLLGTTSTFEKFYSNKMCSGGTLVYSGNDVQDTGNLSNPSGAAQRDCSSGGTFSPGMCCNTRYRHESCSPPTICYYYFDWDVYSGSWSLVPESGCGSSSNCQAGVWESGTGIHYTLFAGAQQTITSPSWDTIPPGTHQVRMCADLPSASVTEGDENNNCGAWYTFTVGGPDFTSSAPNVNSGTLTSGQGVTFYATLSNVGAIGYTGTIPNRFQIDLGNNGTWNTDLDVNVADLASGQNKQPVSPSWTAVEGTHAIRMCADTPASIAEENENNNCGSSLVFTVSAPTQCQDGLDNNGNGLIDLADTYACSSPPDTTEDTLPTGVTSLTLSPGLSLGGKDIVRVNTAAIIDWSAQDVQAGTCTMTGTNGDSFSLSGTSGSQTTSVLRNETVFTLTCTDLNEDLVKSSRTIKVTPYFENI